MNSIRAAEIIASTLEQAKMPLTDAQIILMNGALAVLWEYYLNEPMHTLPGLSAYERDRMGLSPNPPAQGAWPPFGVQKEKP